jgi:hypothetical protein
MRRSRDFKQFLREKYERGQARIQHPDSEKRQRRQDRGQDPTIKFWSAMKYDTFKAKVKREFAAWQQEAEAARPRAEVGARITSPDQLRMGDSVQFYSRNHGYSNYKVVGLTDKSVTFARVDRNGRPLGGATTRFNQNRLRRKSVKRLEELKRKEVSFDKVKEFLDGEAGHPDRDVNTHAKYKAWIEKTLLEKRRSPYERLGDDEPEHQAKLKEQVDKLLEGRGIGEDWSWTTPPHVDIGHRARDPFQLRKHDFIQYGSNKYKVLDVEDNAVLRVQRVDSNGRPEGAAMGFDRRYLENYRVVRVDEVKRPDVDFDQAKKYADDHIGFPDRAVNSQEEYYQWLMENFTEKLGAPFYQLGEDEKKHEKALKKHIDKILDERGVGGSWKWQPPPHAEIGDRIHDPFQLHTGDFFSQRDRFVYKVLEVMDDGRIKAIQINRDTGRPDGVPYTFEKYQIDRSAYKRVEEVKRPDVSFEDAKKYADDHIGYAPPRVNSKSEYREWLEKKYTEHTGAPFYQLGEDEAGHKAQLDKHINKLLDERGVDSDWSWTPPPQADIGQRILDPLQLRAGDFIKREGRSDGWRVVEITPEGKAKMVGIDANGRPLGDTPNEWGADTFGYSRYKRTEPVKRPEVTDEKAKQFADQNLADPGRSARTQEKYREWLNSEFINNQQSPYYQLGDDEPEHGAKLKEQVEKLLKERGVDADWKWKPPPIIEFPSEADWERQHDALRRTALEGDHIRHPGAGRGTKDKYLGGGINNADIRRMRSADGTETDYVFKDIIKERGDGVRVGTPDGTLHQREQAAYGLDRLLGDGVIVPPTVSDGTGSYQHFRDDAKKWGGSGPTGISTRDMSRHADVQRMLFLDEIMGHEDRHFGNLMYAWQDPDGPETADNMRILGIDNGYAFADPEAKHSVRDFATISRAGLAPFKDKVFEDVLAGVPDALHEKIKQIKIPELLDALKKSGITKKASLMATAARIMALQDNPEVIGKFISQGRAADGFPKQDMGRKKWRYVSAKDPAELFRDYTDLPPSAYDDLVKMVDEAAA